MRILESIAELADRYEGFVLDLWGVVHDGKRPYPGVAEALAALKAQGRRVVFLSNAPRRSRVVDGMLAGMGLDRALWHATVTSGELAWRMLAAPREAGLAGRRAVFIGLTDRDLNVIEDRDIALVDDPAEADFILNTGPEPVRGRDSIEPYRSLLAECAARGLPMLCANPDRHVMVGPAHPVCRRAADLYAELGGPRAIEVGKPDPPSTPRAGGAGHRRPRPRGRDRRQPAHRPGRRPGRRDRCRLGADRPGAEAHGEAPDPALLDRVARDEGVAPIAALRGLRW